MSNKLHPSLMVYNPACYIIKYITVLQYIIIGLTLMWVLIKIFSQIKSWYPRTGPIFHHEVYSSKFRSDPFKHHMQVTYQ